MKYQVTAMFNRVTPDVTVERRTKGEAAAQARRWSRAYAPGWNAARPVRIEVRRRDYVRLGVTRLVAVLTGRRKGEQWEWSDAD